MILGPANMKVTSVPAGFDSRLARPLLLRLRESDDDKHYRHREDQHPHGYVVVIRHGTLPNSA